MQQVLLCFHHAVPVIHHVWVFSALPTSDVNAEQCYWKRLGQGLSHKASA